MHNSSQSFLLPKNLNNASALSSLGGRRAAITLKLTYDYQPLVLKQLHSLHSGPSLCCHKIVRCTGFRCQCFSVDCAIPSGCRMLAPIKKMGPAEKKMAIKCRFFCLASCHPLFSQGCCHGPMKSAWKTTLSGSLMCNCSHGLIFNRSPLAIDWV